MFKVTPGPTVFFDCDDTLVMWNTPSKTIDASEFVRVTCRGQGNLLLPHKHNIQLLKQLSSRGHAIVVWSGGGADWAEAVVKALKLEDYVQVVTAKPSYYVDDLEDPKLWMGKHRYISLDGVNPWAMDTENYEELKK